MALSPALARLGSVKPGGFVEPSGLAALVDVLGRPGVASSFDTWRNQPMTGLILNAIRDLIMNQPFGISEEDKLVQYGVTHGLELAYQLMADPSIVVPGAFGASAPGSAQNAVVPEENFDTPADGAS